MREGACEGVGRGHSLRGGVGGRRAESGPEGRGDFGLVYELVEFDLKCLRMDQKPRA